MSASGTHYRNKSLGNLSKCMPAYMQVDYVYHPGRREGELEIHQLVKGYTYLAGSDGFNDTADLNIAN